MLVRAGVATIGELNGRHVAVDGADGAGAALLSDLGVAADLVLTIPNDPAGAIRRGDVDAVVVTGGDPASGLGEVTGGGVALLPVAYGPALERDFVPIRLARSDIPSLVPEAGLETVASLAVLVVYLRRPHSERGATLWSLVAGVLDHAGTPGADAAARALADVNWAADMPGWHRLPAVEAWIDARRRAAGSRQLPIQTEEK